MRDFIRLMTWGKKYWFGLLAILFLIVLLQFLYSYIPLFLRFVFDILALKEGSGLPPFILDFFTNSDSTLGKVLNVCLGIVILQAFRLVMRFFETYNRGRLSENIARDMRVSLFDHINDLSYAYHNHSDNGDLIQRCTSDVDTACGFISNRLPDFVNIIATIIIGAIQVGSINVQLMLCSIIMLPINAIASVIYFRYVNKAFTEIEDEESKMTTIIEENLAGARVVRAFAAEKHEYEKLDKQNKMFSNKRYKFGTVVSFYWGISDFTCFLQYAITVSVAIFLAKDGIVDSGEIVACLILMGMLVWPIRGLGGLISDFGKTIVAVRRIGEVLDEPSEFIQDERLYPEIKGNIEFKNVSFKFADSEQNLINDVTFKISAGQTVAIVGKTGSGKSTIVNILTRMLDYQSGEVLIDGVLIQKIDKKHLRKNIGAVLQDPFLYSRTVYENIAINDLHTNKEKVYEAANVAAIHEDILTFKSGYETIVGEKGATLSGGQKQRVAIARMLVDNKPVLIFDDSLSAVDTQTDLMIRTALKKREKRCTSIIITHRITTAKEADMIIVLNNGAIEDIGTHEQLSKKDGLYKKLWDIQGSLENEFMNILLEKGAKIDG